MRYYVVFKGGTRCCDDTHSQPIDALQCGHLRSNLIVTAGADESDVDPRTQKLIGVDANGQRRKLNHLYKDWFTISFRKASIDNNGNIVNTCSHRHRSIERAFLCKEHIYEINLPHIGVVDSNGAFFTSGEINSHWNFEGGVELYLRQKIRNVTFSPEHGHYI